MSEPDFHVRFESPVSEGVGEIPAERHRLHCSSMDVASLSCDHQICEYDNGEDSIKSATDASSSQHL